VGKASRYLGSRLVVAGVVASAAGLALLVFAGVKTWLAITRGRVGPDAIQAIVMGILALALLSIGRSARRAGLGYLAGDRAISRDIGRFVAARLSRRSRRT
jgi:hypothetical protein